MSNEMEDTVDVKSGEFVLGGYPTVFAERVRNLLFAQPVSMIQELDPARAREHRHSGNDSDADETEATSGDGDDEPENLPTLVRKGAPLASGGS